MKIVTIFATKLFAFQYANERLDEYGRLLDLWNDPEYLFSFAEANKKYIDLLGLSVLEFVQAVLSDAEILEETFCRYKGNSSVIDPCFQPLHDQEYKSRILSFQKKKCKYIRLYAIRIDADCYVITGGAIKITRAMQDHPDTKDELLKMNRCKSYLQGEGIFDNLSFYELITE